MKRLLIFTILLISFFTINAQENQRRFMINAGGTIYSQQSKSPNYLLYPTPELEILYKIHTFKTLFVFAGFRYTYSYSYHDLGYKSEWRRQAHKLAFPLFLEQNIGKFISL